MERLVLPASVQLAFSKESEETQWSQVPEEVSYEVYRIMQELLSNILKHSGATEIDVTLTLKRKLLTLQVSDNGKNYRGSEVHGYRAYYHPRTREDRRRFVYCKYSGRKPKVQARNTIIHLIENRYAGE